VTKPENKTIVTEFRLGFMLNPLKWLVGIANSFIIFFHLPSRILRILGVTVASTVAMMGNDSLGIITRTFTMLAVWATVLFWMIPCAILYPFIKLALCAVLVNFEVNKKMIELEDLDKLGRP
jgi:hypothetical protein